MVENRKAVSDRRGYLDVLKCLAIIFVVMGHIDGMKLGIDTYSTAWGCVRYTFQMPLFFLISGMFASRGLDKGIGIHMLIWQKVKTLVWPAVIFFVLFSLAEGRTIEFPAQGLGCYWFTFTLFECFLIYYVLAFLLKSKRLLNLLLAFVSVGFVGMLALKIDHPSIGFLDLNHLTKYFQYFFLGTLFSLYPKEADRILRSQKVYAFCFVVFCVLMYLVCIGVLPGVLHSLCRDIIVRYVGLFIVFSLFYNAQDMCNKETPLMRSVRYVGRHSLEIYLLHFFFLPTLMWLKPLRGDGLFVVEFPIAIVLSLVVIGIVLILNYMLTRSKYISYLLYGK